MTKLLSRRGLAIAAEEALAFADREGLSMQLLFIDLDQLKEINDQLGHSAGDSAIAHLGKALAAVARSKDVAARIGGDKFVVLLAGSNALDLPDIIERIKTFGREIRRRAACRVHRRCCRTFARGTHQPR